MAKTIPNKKQVSKKPQPQAEAGISKPARASGLFGILSKPYSPYLIIFLFTAGIYSNTIWNQYAIDDALVLTENKFTQQGFRGIKDLMTHDAFVGFFGEKGNELVSGGRYRPLSMVTLAMEVGIFGMNPKISHAINIFLFSLTCLLLYYLLSYLIPGNKGGPVYMSVPFIATMLFAGHPIHTEVVANIKGRDEIMGLMFSLLALFAALRYIKTQNILHLIWGALVFFLALLSKENAITFIAIIPLTYYFFMQAKPKDYVLTIGLYIIPIAAFLLMRSAYTKSGLATESVEILNNPFAYLPKGMDGYIQRYATVIMTFILYFKLLIFPHPLTHDYYFNQIPFIGITNPLFLLSLLINAGLLVYAIIGIRKKEITSYAILFYFITFSIVSNIAFTVGILMNERFVYMCSIGFCLLMAYLLVKAKGRFNLPVQAVMGILIVISLLYSVKTISRNRVWHDNLTLFIVDAKTSTNSARVNMAAGGDLTKLTSENFDTLRPSGRLQYVADLLDMNVDVTSIPDSTLKNEFLRRSIEYLNRTVSIYPTHASAWLLLGNASYKLHKDPKETLEDYEKAAAYEPGGSYDIWYNIGCVELENNMPAQAKDNFIKALNLKSDKIDARLNLGVAYMNLNMTDSSLYWFKRALELNPHDGLTYYKMGTLYGRQLNKLDMAAQCVSKAIEYNPNDKSYYEDLGVVYGLQNRPDDAIRVSEECLKKFPNYLPALRNIAISYYKKGDMQKAHEYDNRLAQLTGQSNGGIFK